MRPAEVTKYFFDIAQACDLSAQFTKRKTFNDYVADAMLRSAVERQFEVIGEAVREAVRRDPSLADRISDVERIIAFRNRLIHAYASVADEVVWGIVEAKLPTLARQITGLLDER
jgi:uncharacterized protein with HEPN domain